MRSHRLITTLLTAISTIALVLMAVPPPAGADDGTELHRTDGTLEGTELVADIASDPCGFAAGGDGVVFLATDEAHGREPWTSEWRGPGRAPGPRCFRFFRFGRTEV